MAHASGATLILDNNIVKGRLWEAFKRPGTLTQMGNQVKIENCFCLYCCDHPTS